MGDSNFGTITQWGKSLQNIATTAAISGATAGLISVVLFRTCRMQPITKSVVYRVHREFHEFTYINLTVIIFYLNSGGSVTRAVFVGIGLGYGIGRHSQKLCEDIDSGKVSFPPSLREGAKKIKSRLHLPEISLSDYTRKAVEAATGGKGESAKGEHGDDGTTADADENKEGKDQAPESEADNNSEAAD